MNFHIRAFISNRSPELIKLSALSQEEALNKVESQGYTVLSIREHRSGLNRVSRFPIMLFIQELSTLFDSGLSITEALSTLIEKEVDSYIQLVLRDVLSAIENGRQLSDAFALQSSVFSPLFIATVKACETSGNLSEGLKRYALYLEQVDLLRKKIISASIYPSIVLGFGVLVLLFLFTYVVPKFSQIYESRVNELSFSAEILLAIGSFVQLHPYLILIIALSSVGFFVGFAFLPNMKRYVVQLLMTMPRIGSRIRIYHLSRFYRTFAMLLRSGIPVVSALSKLDDLLGDSLSSNIRQAKSDISQGHSFSDAMNKNALTTVVSRQLFRVGEKSGRLDVMMERAAAFHEEEMSRWIDAFTKVFEPVLMAGIGLIIGLVVLLMYLPIFELASGIQ